MNIFFRNVLELIRINKSYLSPTGGEPRVSSYTTHQVEFALSVARQVDGSLSDMDVHQVVNYSALNVVLDPVHQVPATHIKDFDVGQIPA